jgi:ribose transport system ATP-binding protein
VTDGNTAVPFLQFKGIDKYYDVTQALANVDMDIHHGEVIGLIGPNGAGKSTLIKIITGVLSPSAGTIAVAGEPVGKYTTKEAKELGIACAYQDFSLCTNLKVYENFAISSIGHNLAGERKWRSQYKCKSHELLDRYFPGNMIDVSKPVERLSLAERQVVEICKTLSVDNLQLLILDEPTSALSSDKAEQLHAVVRDLCRRNVTVIYISHKLEEIKVVSDRIVVLKNGRNNGEFQANEISRDELIEKMGGGAPAGSEFVKTSVSADAPVIIDVKKYSADGINDISISVRKGEIVGISGLVGSGQPELLDVLFAAGRGSRRRSAKGDIRFNGTVAYVSGDREREGVFHLWNISDNIAISMLNRSKAKFFLDMKALKDTACAWYAKLKFRAEGIGSPIKALSGGNQQKALIARGIASGADVILLNDPTAGVDVGTKHDIYQLLQEAKREGKSVVLYSTEDSEMQICDRVYVLHEGCITEDLTGDSITVTNIVKASFAPTVTKRTVVQRQRRSFLDSRLMLPLLAMLIMVGVNAFLNPNILSYFGVRTIVGSAVPLVFAALGQMFIVLAGDIDMGNGYSIGLVNVIVAVLLTQNPFVGVVSLVIFICCYMLMGLLIHVRRLPAIVVTLGAQFVWLGVALIICPSAGGTCPAWLVKFYKFKMPFVPMPLLIAFGAGLLSWFLLFRAKYGMVMRGIGNNPVAVERAGWSYLRARITNFGISALMVVFSGMSFTAVCLGADANSSSSFCMQSFATIILGGCEFAGGIAEPFGVVCAAIAMALITSLLIALKIDSNFQTAVTGIILILVLAIKAFSMKQGGRKK